MDRPGGSLRHKIGPRARAARRGRVQNPHRHRTVEIIQHRVAPANPDPRHPRRRAVTRHRHPPHTALRRVQPRRPRFRNRHTDIEIRGRSRAHRHVEKRLPARATPRLGINRHALRRRAASRNRRQRHRA